MKKMSVLGAVALLLCLTSTLSAAPACLADTMAAYVALGAGGCQIGSALFNNFNYDSTGTTNITSQTQVLITPTGLGFTFSAPTVATGVAGQMGFGSVTDDSATYTIMYYAHTGDANLFWSGITAGVTDLRDEGGSSSASFNKRARTDTLGTAFGTPFCNTVAACGTTVGTTTNLFSTLGGFTGSTPLVINPHVNYIRVRDTVSIQNDSGLDSGVTSFYNSPFTSVPEPATMALMGLGLVAIGFARTRRKA